MKRVLVFGDAGCHTGFARVVKGIADHLHGTGEFEVNVRGINFRPNHDVAYDYDVQPISYEQADPLGSVSIQGHIEAVQPDALFMVSDLWNLAAYSLSIPRNFPTVMYFPVDTPCMKWSYSMALGAASEVATYTHFGAREVAASLQTALDLVEEEAVEENAEVRTAQAAGFSIPREDRELYCRMDRVARWQNATQWNIIPHGLDKHLWEPRDQLACRRAFNLPERAFIVSAIGSNQFRKRLDITVRAFAQYAEINPKAWLLLHCHGGDLNGWDLAQLTRYYGVHQRTICTHFDYPTLSDHDLCTLYNTADVNINTSGGEGWGLCSFESAACGIPQAVPDWSGTRELWKDHGLLLPVSDWRHEPKFLNTAHAIVDVPGVVNALYRLTDEETRAQWGQKARLLATEQLTWDQVGSGFHQLLTRALNEPAPKPLSFTELLSLRETRLTSELQPRPHAI